MIELHHGDNLDKLLDLTNVHGDSITLAYLDPPFFTNKQHVMKNGQIAFDDRWTSREAFISSLEVRIALVRMLLAPQGVMVLHLDSRTSHHAKVMCDRVFGSDCFESEIVWRYRRWPTKTQNFQRVHDVLLRYRKDPKVAPRWNQLYEPLAESTRSIWGTKKQCAVFEGGHRKRSSIATEESRGVPLGDVWEIGILAPTAHERTGYPTQKPEALLERVILACSNPGDLVLDPFCGSGTTLAVSKRLGRPCIGIDSSEVAIKVASQRLGIEQAA